mmetsp:Transcript_2184/g.2811  ORF Transcript_2184/g.2811 Transcript_2184/m.2811 type:complete len:390 (-) Transcript_2184:1332-2501(-)
MLSARSNKAIWSTWSWIVRMMPTENVSSGSEVPYTFKYTTLVLATRSDSAENNVDLAVSNARRLSEVLSVRVKMYVLKLFLITNTFFMSLISQFFRIGRLSIVLMLMVDGKRCLLTSLISYFWTSLSVGSGTGLSLSFFSGSDGFRVISGTSSTAFGAIMESLGLRLSSGISILSDSSVDLTLFIFSAHCSIRDLFNFLGLGWRLRRFAGLQCVGLLAGFDLFGCFHQADLEVSAVDRELLRPLSGFVETHEDDPGDDCLFEFFDYRLNLVVNFCVVFFSFRVTLNHQRCPAVLRIVLGRCNDNLEQQPHRNLEVAVGHVLVPQLVAVDVAHLGSCSGVGLCVEVEDPAGPQRNVEIFVARLVLGVGLVGLEVEAFVAGRRDGEKHFFS